MGFTWIVLLAFVRLTTRQGLFPRPLAPAEALQVVRHWLEQPAAVLVEPTSRHLDVLTRLLHEADGGSTLVTDAHLASVALEHAATVVSFDDFRRFSGVAWHLPR